jgi:hypothetical protein
MRVSGKTLCALLSTKLLEKQVMTMNISGSSIRLPKLAFQVIEKFPSGYTKAHSHHRAADMSYFPFVLVANLQSQH